MSKDVTIQNIPFRLYTVKEKGLYYGRWVCLDCANVGESSKSCGSEEEAIKAANGNAAGHAALKHGKRA